MLFYNLNNLKIIINLIDILKNLNLFFYKFKVTLSQFSLINTINIGSRFHGHYEANRIVCCPIPLFTGIYILKKVLSTFCTTYINLILFIKSPKAFGLVLGCLSPLVISNKVIIPSHSGTDSMATMRSISEENCTLIGGSPSHFTDMLNHPDQPNFDFKSLQLALLSATHITNVLVKQIRASFKLKHVTICYGLTESSSAGTLTKSDQEATKGSIGVPYPFTECKVVDPCTGDIVLRNVDGVLCMRGAQILVFVKNYSRVPFH